MEREKIVKISKAVECGLLGQKNDDGIVEVINTDRLGIKETPEVVEYQDNESEWKESGLKSPNSWRFK